MAIPGKSGKSPMNKYRMGAGVRQSIPASPEPTQGYSPTQGPRFSLLAHYKTERKQDEEKTLNVNVIWQQFKRNTWVKNRKDAEKSKICFTWCID